MAFIQRVNGTVNSNAITITPNSAGDTFAGVADLSGSATVLTFADGGVNNTYGYAIYTPGGRQFALWWVLSCKAGATTITVTADVGTIKFLMIDEYSGGYNAVQNSSGTFANINSPGTGTNAITTGTFNQTSQPALVWGAVGDANLTATALVAGTNFTLRGGAAGIAGYDMAFYTEDLTSSATGNIAATWTALSAGQFDHMYQGMLIFTTTIGWTRVGYGAFTSGNNVTLTPAIPTGSVGDLLLLFLGEQIGSDVVPVISGWTNISPQVHVKQQGIYARIATGSDAVSVPFNWSNGDIWAQVGRYSNVNGIGPISTLVTASVDLSSTASNQYNYSALTIPSANNLVLLLGVLDYTASGAFSAPSTGSFSIVAQANGSVGGYAVAINEWIQTVPMNITVGSQAYSGTATSQNFNSIILSLAIQTLMGQACL